MRQASRRIALLAVPFALAAQLPARGGDLADACADAGRRIAAAREELAQSRKLIGDRRAALRAEMAGFEEQLRASEKAVEQIEKLEERAIGDTEKAEAGSAEIESELRRSFEAMRENRKELEAVVLHAGPTYGIFEQLDGMLSSGGGDAKPTELATGLLAIYRTLFEGVSSVRKGSGEVLLPNGSSCRGTLLLCGAFGGLFVSDAANVIGLANLPQGARNFHVTSEGLTGAERSAIEETLRGGGTVAPVPLDISGGAVAARQKSGRTWAEWFRSGGLVMYPLALIALLSVLIVAERSITLGRANADVEKLLARLLPMVRKGDLAGAGAALKEMSGRMPGPIHRVMETGIENAGRSESDIEEVVEEAALAEVPGLERYLATLAVFATVSPLLGLLGTVSGMIATFHVLTVHGSGSARLLSGGISEALTATQAGLAIAIAVLFVHAALTRRARVIVSRMELAANALVGAIRDRGTEAS